MENKNKYPGEEESKKFERKEKKELTFGAKEENTEDPKVVEKLQKNTTEEIKNLLSRPLTTKITKQEIAKAPFAYEHNVTPPMQNALNNHKEEIREFLRSKLQGDQLPGVFSLNQMEALGKKIMQETTWKEESTLQFEYKRGNIHIFATYK